MVNDQRECYLKGVTFRVRAFSEMNEVSVIDYAT